LKTFALGALLTLGYLHSTAQKASVPLNEPDYNKSKLFADLPQRMNLKVKEMEALFSLPVGTVINTQATDQLKLQGTIVSKAEDATLKSVVIRSTNKQGAIFTFTKIVSADGSYNYIGRMISRQHGDAFEIVKENGQYVLNKIGVYDLLSE
jgi:hypothetical protein